MQIDASKQLELPSIHDSKPLEEGGPVARIGFNYQDEIAVGLLLEMLESENIECVYCETHDDAVVVFDDNSVEYVQVKSNDSFSAWSLSSITARENKKEGTSIYEKSLARDAFRQEAFFRLVTLRDVGNDISFLKYPLGKPGREPEHDKVTALCAELEKRCPDVKSPKGNGSSYWVGKCTWDVRESQQSVARHNLLRLYKICAKLGHSILLEPIEEILRELRKMARAAGDAKWEPDKEKKIFRKNDLVDWLTARLQEIDSSIVGASGGKLRQKLSAAGMSQDLIRLAAEMRRRYSEEVRTPRYMKADDVDGLQRLVRRRVLLLQARREADELGDVSDTKFHSMCLASAGATTTGDEDQSDFQLGCMYDITDRCLLRFTREKK